MNALSLYQHCRLESLVGVRSESQDTLPAEAMDLSDKLMRVRVGEPFAPGTSVEVELNFSGEDSTGVLSVGGEVLDHFAEPETGLWQVGIRLKFDDPALERTVTGYLSSCQGMF